MYVSLKIWTPFQRYRKWADLSMCINLFSPQHGLSFQIMKQFRRKRCLTDKINRVREILMTSRTSGGSAESGSGVGSAASRVAAKDMDHVIGEMALLQARTEMYFKFIRKRAQVRASFPRLNPSPYYKVYYTCKIYQLILSKLNLCS